MNTTDSGNDGYVNTPPKEPPDIPCDYTDYEAAQDSLPGPALGGWLLTDLLNYNPVDMVYAVSVCIIEPWGGTDNLGT